MRKEDRQIRDAITTYILGGGHPGDVIMALADVSEVEATRVPERSARRAWHSLEKKLSAEADRAFRNRAFDLK